VACPSRESARRLAVASSAKLARGEAGETQALACQVRLIGVARVERGSSEVVALAGEEPAEAEDALKDLRAVADGRQEASSQLSFAEAEIRGQRLDALTGVEETPDSGLNGGIRRAGSHEARGRSYEQAGHGAGIAVTAHLLAWVEAQRGDRDPVVS
jgi:hypothetical protein